MPETRGGPTPGGRGRYCHDPEASEWLEGLVSRTVNLVLGEFGEHRVQAILPLGSLARGEASVCRDGDRFVLLGDMEFFVVLGRPFSVGRARKTCKDLSHRASTALSVRPGEVEVDLAPTSVDRLARTSDRTMFACDLRTNRRCVWGDPAVLDALPPPEPAAIPKEDALRLVSNRIVELAMAQDSGDPLREAYWKAKVLLDLAGSLLAYRGRHESSYARRFEALSRLVAGAGSLAWVAGPEGFLRRLPWATRWKLEPSKIGLGDGSLAPTGDQVAAWTRAVWEWEVREWLGGGPGVSTMELVSRYKSRESARERLRGWLKFAVHPLRPRGALGLGRFLRLLPQASPQTLLYASIILDVAGNQDGREDWRRRALGLVPVEVPERGRRGDPVGALAGTWEWLLK